MCPNIHHDVKVLHIHHYVPFLGTDCKNPQFSFTGICNPREVPLSGGSPKHPHSPNQALFAFTDQFQLAFFEKVPSTMMACSYWQLDWIEECLGD